MKTIYFTVLFLLVACSTQDQTASTLGLAVSGGLQTESDGETNKDNNAEKKGVAGHYSYIKHTLTHYENMEVNMYVRSDLIDSDCFIPEAKLYIGYPIQGVPTDQDWEMGQDDLWVSNYKRKHADGRASTMKLQNGENGGTNVTITCKRGKETSEGYLTNYISGIKIESIEMGLSCLTQAGWRYSFPLESLNQNCQRNSAVYDFAHIVGGRCCTQSIAMPPNLPSSYLLRRS